MSTEEEFEPLQELQSRVLRNVNFLHYLCKELESPQIINFWTHPINIEDQKVNGTIYEVKDETAYQLLVDLVTGISGELLSLIPLTIHVKTTEFPILAKRIAIYLDHFYIHNLTSWSTLFKQLLVTNDAVRRSLKYKNFATFIQQYMSPEEKALLRTKLDAKYDSLIDATSSEYVLDAVKSLEKDRKQKKKPKKKEDPPSRAIVLQSKQYATHRQYLQADYQIQKEQEFDEIVDLSLFDPEKLKQQKITALKYHIHPDEVVRHELIFAQREKTERHIDKMQVECSLYIQLYCVPLLRQALTLLKTPYNLLFLQRQRLEHELDLLSTQAAQNLDALVKSVAKEKQFPSVFGEDKEKEKEVLYSEQK